MLKDIYSTFVNGLYINFVRQLRLNKDFPHGHRGLVRQSNDIINICYYKLKFLGLKVKRDCMYFYDFITSDYKINKIATLLLDTFIYSGYNRLLANMFRLLDRLIKECLQRMQKIKSRQRFHNSI